jgi:hypothetical protein
LQLVQVSIAPGPSLLEPLEGVAAHLAAPNEVRPEQAQEC